MKKSCDIKKKRKRENKDEQKEIECRTRENICQPCRPDHRGNFYHGKANTSPSSFVLNILKVLKERGSVCKPDVSENRIKIYRNETKD